MISVIQMLFKVIKMIIKDAANLRAVSASDLHRSLLFATPLRDVYIFEDGMDEEA
jgi:hypothetical protein